jgi:hypothetical protein
MVGSGAAVCEQLESSEPQNVAIAIPVKSLETLHP